MVAATRKKVIILVSQLSSKMIISHARNAQQALFLAILATGVRNVLLESAEDPIKALDACEKKK